MADHPRAKSLVAAYFIWFFLGYFGFHRMYLGRLKTGFLMLGMLLCVLAIFLVIGLAEDTGGLSDTLLIPLSVISIGTAVVWFVWYLADVVLIAIMVRRDRAQTAKQSPDTLETIFK